MVRFLLHALGVGVLLVGAMGACGSSVTEGGAGAPPTTTTGSGGTGATGAGGTTSSSSSTGLGGTGAGGSGVGGIAGDCIDDADCGGASCLEIVPGGYRTCESAPPEATACDPSHMIEDDCCTSDDCEEGGCYLFTDLPYCGGPQPAEYNTCVYDQCTSDSDCVGVGTVPTVCAPAGAFGNPMRTCVVAFCTSHEDCTDAPGGHCEAIDNSCCPEPSGLGCVYAGGCENDGQCEPTDHCELDYETGHGVCASGPMPCPA